MTRQPSSSSRGWLNRWGSPGGLPIVNPRAVILPPLKDLTSFQIAMMLDPARVKAVWRPRTRWENAWQAITGWHFGGAGAAEPNTNRRAG